MRVAAVLIMAMNVRPRFAAVNRNRSLQFGIAWFETALRTLLTMTDFLDGLVNPVFPRRTRSGRPRPTPSARVEPGNLNPS
jgi:hypothetical protein